MSVGRAAAQTTHSLPSSLAEAAVDARTYFKKNLVLHNEELSLEGTMASAERDPITGIWAEPPAGSRGRAPGQRFRGETS